jgi:hypothetical protein
LTRKLVKHASGYICEDVSRDNWYVGQQTEGGRPTMNVGGTIQYRWFQSHGTERERRGSSLMSKLDSWTGAFFAVPINHRPQTPEASSFKQCLTPVTLLEASRPSVSDKGYIICSSCSKASSSLDWKTTSFSGLPVCRGLLIVYANAIKSLLHTYNTYTHVCIYSLLFLFLWTALTLRNFRIRKCLF